MTEHDQLVGVPLANDAVLWRRIHRGSTILDEDRHCTRATSQGFRDATDGSPMSLYIADEMIMSQRGAHTLLIGHSDYGIAAVTAGQVQAYGWVIRPADPPDNPPDSAHVEVHGNKSKSQRSKLAALACWIICPPAITNCC